MNFWNKLPTPFFALAPMEDVTDTVFRELVLSSASPDLLQVVFTEFLSVDGFLHETGKNKVIHRLHVSSSERSILQGKGIKLVVQIWGSDPEKFYRAAKEISDNYMFDGIDINMGCPVGKIIKKNACSALIKYPKLAQEIVLATKEATHLPVSVKTRMGFNTVVTEEWIGHLLQVNPAAITLHGRIQKMQSEGAADWNEIQKAVHVRNSVNSVTKIVGNGDVISVEDGLHRSNIYQTDGIMIGRGIFRNPLLFSLKTVLSIEEKTALLKFHVERFKNEWEKQKNYAILKRFYKIYINGFEGASALRAELMNTRDYAEAFHLIEQFENIHFKNKTKSVAWL